MTTRLRAIFTHTHTGMWMVLQISRGNLCNKGSEQARHETEGWILRQKRLTSSSTFVHTVIILSRTMQTYSSSPNFLLQGVEFWNCACLMLAAWCDSSWQAEASLGATCPSLPVPLTPPHPLSTLTQHRRIKLSHRCTNDAGRIP